MTGSGPAKGGSGEGRLPDFVVIGAMKCGTTSLFRYLGLHPQVGVPDRKELDFFVEGRGWEQGVDWYRGQFAGLSGAARVGECSPNYTARHYFAGVAERMHAVLPDARLVYVVRDPVDRMVSQFVHQVAAGRERRSLEDALPGDDPDGSEYVLTSRYRWQLEPYLGAFRREQIRVVSFEALVRRPAGVMGSVFDFLGVDPDFDHPDFGRAHNETSEKEVPTQLGRRIGRLGRSVLGRIAPRSVWERAVLPEIHEHLRGRLAALVEEDVRELRALTGESFAEWRV